MYNLQRSLMEGSNQSHQSQAQQELNYETNFRYIRYADVLLMAAEANNRATASNDTKAQNYLNQVIRLKLLIYRGEN